MVIGWSGDKFWHDISCSNHYRFICGMPFCKRELTLTA
jgi:hypothetical protein